MRNETETHIGLVDSNAVLLATSKKFSFDGRADFLKASKSNVFELDASVFCIKNKAFFIYKKINKFSSFNFMNELVKN
jgi:hypothetical protein